MPTACSANVETVKRFPFQRVRVLPAPPLSVTTPFSRRAVPPRACISPFPSRRVGGLFCFTELRGPVVRRYELPKRLVVEEISVSGLIRVSLPS